MGISEYMSRPRIFDWPERRDGTTARPPQGRSLHRRRALVSRVEILPCGGLSGLCHHPAAPHTLAARSLRLEHAG